MKYCESIILLPCHSLEDFPVHHEGDDAQSLLANWTALWHPALIAACESIPHWSRVDDPPVELADRLLVAPSVSGSELPTGFSQRAKQDGAVYVRGKNDRNEIIDLALKSLDGGDRGVDTELAADFLALGYCYLQVELLTRQMRYASNLDEVHFNNQTVAAAAAAVNGAIDEAKEKLMSCFDLLAQERDHYYPVEAFLLDLTLVAATTIGSSFREEFADVSPRNLLIAGDVVNAMAKDEPASIDMLKTALESGNADLIGGESVERRLPLFACETILAELKQGESDYLKHLGRRPKIYGRRRFGLTPSLPQILHKCGFEGALHATLDDGRFPEGIQIKSRWEGSDGASIDALARAPLDATKPETYLALAVKMGESMDSDHVATVCLAHWPGQSSPWLEDLRRVARYSSALGKFITFEQYFRDTDDSGHMERYTADQYRSPYLKQAIIRRQEDPISTSANYWRRRTAGEAISNLNVLGSLITGDVGDTSNEILAEIDASADSDIESGFDKRLGEQLAYANGRFANSLPRNQGERRTGYLVANPYNFVRRICAEMPELSELPTVEKPIYASGEAIGTKHVIVDIPPMGFVWVPSGKSPPKKQRREPKPLIEDRCELEGYLALRNEFFEILIDSTTGSLRSLYEYKSRGNRLSYQLAYRMPSKQQEAGEQWKNSDESTPYSVMAADSIQVTQNGTTLGEVVVKGRLLDLDGTNLSNFTQTYRLCRGKRVLELDIEVDPQTEPRADPWNSYFAARFAWSDEAVDLWCTVNQSRQPVSNKRFESTQYIDIEGVDSKKRTTILTGGLPFHQRCGARMLDSILIVRGESGRKFRMGVGIDVSQPMHAAIDLLAPACVTQQVAATPTPAASSWLFHIDAKNIIATHWEPILSDGNIEGFRARLLETAGRSVQATLSSFRNVKQAKQVDFQGNSLGECKVDEGRVRLDFSAGEWIEVEGRW